MKTIKINACGEKYLSNIPELKDGLPTGVFNKKSPDCGGSYLCMNCDTNYILVSPSKNLVDSLSNDRNNKYDILAVRAGIYSHNIQEYVSSHNIKKIAVTWDSLYKVLDALKECGQDLSTYRIVLDEYHLTIANYNFRSKAINSMMKVLKEFSHYTFMSASPIQSKYEYSFLKELPHYEVIWSNTREVSPIRIRSTNPFASTVTLINTIKDGMELIDINGELTKVDEVCIFLNSVEGIKTIIENANLKPSEVKILCGDNIRNKLILDEFKINKVYDDNKRFTFITSTGFQGITLESNNCLNVVVSDGNRQHTFVNVDRDILQISGRQRTNDTYQNCFRDRIWHIYSMNNNPEDYELIEQSIDKLKEEAINSIEGLKLVKHNELYYNSLLDVVTKAEDKTFICIEDNEPLYSDIKEMHLREQNEIQNYIYTNGMRIREAYINAGYTVDKQRYHRDELHLKMCSKVGFKELWSAYINDMYKTEFDIEYPKFKLIKEHITESELKHLMYVEDKVLSLLDDKLKLNEVYSNIHNKYGDGFVPSSVLKDEFIHYFTLLGIKLTPKASLIEQCKWLDTVKCTKRIDGNKIAGYSVKVVKGYNIKSIV